MTNFANITAKLANELKIAEPTTKKRGPRGDVWTDSELRILGREMRIKRERGASLVILMKQLPNRTKGAIRSKMHICKCLIENTALPRGADKLSESYLEMVRRSLHMTGWHKEMAMYK